jgi:hypothetical protein
MMQTALDFSAPPLAQARAVGQAAQQLATDRAEREAPGFRERAEAAILARLATGPASGEDCTDYVAASGIQFADGRALGSVYASMARRSLIRCVGFCLRKRGNGTAGGRIWERCA